MTREERDAFFRELGYEHRIFIDEKIAKKLIAEEIADYYIHKYQREHPEATKDQLRVAREIAIESANEVFMEHVKDENIDFRDYEDLLQEATDYKEE